MDAPRAPRNPAVADVLGAGPDARLPLSRRLKNAQYRAVFDGRRRWAGRWIVIWCLRNHGQVSARLGIVASRRAFRRAVDRNRARRRMREVFRLNRCSLAADADLVLVARSAMARASFAAIESDFRHACRRLGIWKEPPC